MIHYNGWDTRTGRELCRRSVIIDLQNRIWEVERVKNWGRGILELCISDVEGREVAKYAFSMALDLRKRDLIQRMREIS